MLKWVVRIFYFIFIIFLTAQVFSFSYFSRLQAYYDDQIRDHIDDDAVFIQGMNTLLQTNYIRETPKLYEFASESGDYQFKIALYAVSASQEDERYDGLMIFVNQLKIFEDGLPIENPVLRINFALNLETLKTGDAFSNEGSIIYDATQPFAFYNLPTVFLFDTDGYMKSEDGRFAELESISLYYSNGTVGSNNQFVFSNDPFFLATTYETAENVLGNHKDTLFIDTALYRMRDVFESEFPTDAELMAYHLNTDKDSLSAYNLLVWRTMSIYVLVVSGITYLIFFHKKVKEALALKRMFDKRNEVKSESPIFKD